jgi:hypothetical protein
MDIVPTAGGLRLSQHGVVISELRSTPSPTHSVFDVLAALIFRLAPPGRVGLLGFAGGGLMAPLRHLGWDRPLDTVDLDEASYALFQQHCGSWTSPVNWERGDAVGWLERQRARFACLIEDLSIAEAGDVVKPQVTWRGLPGLVRRRLAPEGIALFNLLPPPGGQWEPELGKMAAGFRRARVVELDGYENRILVGGTRLATGAVLGRTLRATLRELGSQQADQVRVRQID